LGELQTLISKNLFNKLGELQTLISKNLFNKLGELQTLISKKKYDIIAIAEIFPRKQNLDYNDNLWNIPGYTFHYPTKKVFTHFIVRGFVIYTKVEDFLHDRKQ
jgi:hypothetical protein